MNQDETRAEEPLLTQFSKGAGCGCKISPAELEKILSSSFDYPDSRLLVGNSMKDDAAVVDLGNGAALVSTTDFFTPILDDPFHFGQAAAANAISDIYAMGGSPLVAIAILGWPIGKLPSDMAASVLDGAREVCAKAGISLAGGHSIESPEPFFGLSVNGLVQTNNLKKNHTAQQGDILFLTKPLGTGILSTALKRKALSEEHLLELTQQLTTLNLAGKALGEIAGVHAMTDVTGFGLAGHLIEMAAGSGLSAKISYKSIPVMNGAREYLAKRIVPDATFRNWNSYQNDISFAGGVDIMEAFSLLPDPQTNGGLLLAVAPDAVEQVQMILCENGLEEFVQPIGVMIEKNEKTVLVEA